MKLKEIFKTEESWIQGVMARDKNNRMVEPEDSEAVKFCLMGAIALCYPNLYEKRRVHKKIKSYHAR